MVMNTVSVYSQRCIDDEIVDNWYGKCVEVRTLSPDPVRRVWVNFPSLKPRI